MNEENFGKGGIKSPKDKRDFQWEKVGSASLPFDWEKGFETIKPLKVKNQNGSSSCGGQALSYYGEILNAKSDGTQEERSAKFIYAPIAVAGGGTWGRELMNWVVKSGWGLEKDTPSYENGNPPSEAFMTRKEDITLEAHNYAINERALSYVNITDTTSIDTIAQAIRDNNGALIGVDGINNNSWHTKFPIPPIKDFVWRHWILAVGAVMIDGKKYIKIINSWGNVGDNGYQYLGEEYFTSGHCFEAWTAVYNTAKPEIGFKHTFNTNLTIGDKGVEVLALQKALRLEGLFKYPTDTGTYGPVTKEAVYQFQIKYNLAPFTRRLYQGIYVREITRKRLNELYSP